MSKAIVLLLLLLLAGGVIVTAGVAFFVLSVGTSISTLDFTGVVVNSDGTPAEASAVTVYSPIQGCSFTYAERRRTDGEGRFSASFKETFTTSLLTRRARAPRPAAFGLSIPSHSDDDMYIIGMPAGARFTVGSCGLWDGYTRAAPGRPIEAAGTVLETDTGWRVEVRIVLPAATADPSTPR